MNKKIIIIGSGFSGLSSACYLSQAGFKVQVIEKNKHVGGRARVLKHKGFSFDMGPSWYWMPDVFDSFFADFSHQTSDFYELKRLDPGYRVFFGKNDFQDIPSKWDSIKSLFESIEKGSSEKLQEFIDEAGFKYEMALQDYMYRPSHSFVEFIELKGLRNLKYLGITKSISQIVRKHFKHPKLVSILEFPVLFLGAKPEDMPSLYSLMNYADLKLGTWYPQGGMYEVIKGMHKLALELGVEFQTETEVESIECEGNQVIGVKTNEGFVPADAVIGSADYHHVDKHLLPKDKSNYTEKYWDKRVMAPSSLLFFVGLDKKFEALEHHNLFFDEDFNIHGQDIYDNPKWPENPQMYASVATRTDDSIAPDGKDALVGLIPIAAGLTDSDEIKEKYFDKFISKIENLIGEEIRPHILFNINYAGSNFTKDYNAFKGNAYGLANTITQTAFLKPKLKNKHLKNMFYTGQLTVPGPGVPPSIISGKIVAKEVISIFE